MKKSLIDNLICPVCKKNCLVVAEVNKEDQREIYDGILRCQSCHKEYAIENGIPIFLLNREMQHQYVPGANPSSNRRQFFERRELAYRENLDKKWVMSSTANFNQVFNYLQITGKENVLEIGAGTCWSIQRFAERGCNCVAVDLLSWHKLELADYWFSEKGIYFERILADMNQSIFCDNMFDIVYGVSSIMYSKDVSATFREINRVLRPGGKLILIGEPVAPFYQTNRDCKRIGSGSAYTILEWDHYMTIAGLKVRGRFFAESTKMRFADPELITCRNRWYYFLAKILNPLVKTKLFRNIKVDKLSLLLLFSGMLPLVVVAEKKK